MDYFENYCIKNVSELENCNRVCQLGGDKTWSAGISFKYLKSKDLDKLDAIVLICNIEIIRLYDNKGNKICKNEWYKYIDMNKYDIKHDKKMNDSELYKNKNINIQKNETNKIIDEKMDKLTNIVNNLQNNEMKTDENKINE